VAINRFQENRGDSIPAADRDATIAPYSVSQWLSQANGAVPDYRAGFVEGVLLGAGNDGSVVTGTEPNVAPAYADGFLAAHTVSYALNNTKAHYQAALRYLGFDASGPSPLCSGAYASMLVKFGYKPLANTGGVTCIKS
jgi:phosphate transport system substrate-binding protein